MFVQLLASHSWRARVDDGPALRQATAIHSKIEVIAPRSCILVSKCVCVCVPVFALFGKSQFKGQEQPEKGREDFPFHRVRTARNTVQA
eukprot:s642_g29.t1